MFKNSSKLLKIFSLYAILIGYIKLTEIFKNNISTINNYSFNVAAYNLLNIIFYLLIIILIYLISLEKSNKSIETLFLFIPAIIFILSPFLSLFINETLADTIPVNYVNPNTVDYTDISVSPSYRHHPCHRSPDFHQPCPR